VLSRGNTTIHAVTEQEQVNALWELQGLGDELEEELKNARATRIEAYQGGGLHASDVYEVVVETGRIAYFKPANGLLGPVGSRALRNYDHTLLSTTISECAAWQLAKNMGEPWRSLVAPTALRFITLPDGKRDVGALTVYRPGREKQRGYLDIVPDLASAGAFFDALIGQQDRNDGNILWYEERRQIYLIDHGFSFARPGANSGEVILTNWRAGQGTRMLSDREVEVLNQLAGSEIAGLGSFVEPGRFGALSDRVTGMLASHEMPLVGSF
jgi:hypothetical protein